MNTATRVMKVTMNKADEVVPGVGRVVGGGIHCSEVYDATEVDRMRSKGFQIVRAWWITIA